MMRLDSALYVSLRTGRVAVLWRTDMQQSPHKRVLMRIIESNWK